MLGVIGGTGLYEIEGLRVKEERELKTPFGHPSDKFIIGEIDRKEIVFLPRHSKVHTIPPLKINFRANIYAMKVLGVDRIVSVSAVGSMKEHIKPGDVVIPDQFIDRTRGRLLTFFEEGICVHIGFAEPVCPELIQALRQSAKDEKLTVHTGGTYICIEGPRFSTKAESFLYRSWGVDVIGMTNLPEASLAREAEICYATLAFPTDYDCWYEREEVVSAKMVVETLKKNVEKAKRIIGRVIRYIPEERKCPCKDALRDAIVTSKDKIPTDVIEKLRPIIGKYL